jgi:hypothetical protein
MGKRIKIQIGNRVFETAKAAEDACRAVLYGDVSAPESQAFLADLLERHPERDQKVGVGISHFFDGPDGFGGRCFRLRRIDGSQTDFSFKSCLKPPTSEQEAVAGFRTAIQPQIRDFRDREFYGRDEVRCALTMEPIPRSRAHIDHEPPQTFRALLDAFLLGRGIALGSVKVQPTEDSSTVTRLADPVLEADWQRHHLASARLRVTSARANLSQGSGRR